MDAPLPRSAPLPRRTTLALGGVLIGAALLGSALRRPAAAPGRDGPPALQLDTMLPRRFGSWQEDLLAPGLMVNPQTQELLDKLYAQVLARTYVAPDGYRVMLSIAYGHDQRGGLQAHRPEACYPAQGFTLERTAEAEIATPFGSIPGRRLQTRLRQRIEPVTYWFAASGTAVRDRLSLRLLEARLWLTGRVPDGLLFRVSSIDAESERAFSRHEGFIADLLAALSPADRARLSGLPAPTVAPTATPA